MKKTLAAAITSAIVIGAASTTFAAANPFSDVPTDHWSFDAVAKLAQEGVIEGYGDNTFRGDAHITRYEMAQMVAKAMAKDLSGADKATVDKLAAEYADELNNLGVRVANLEERSDNVKLTGLLRLDGTSIDVDGYDRDDSGNAKLRLDIDAKVNADWHVKGRLDGDVQMETSTSSDAKLVRAYAEGPLFGATAKFGKFGAYDADHLSASGLIMDTEVTGAEFKFDNNDKFSTTLTYGRLETPDGTTWTESVYGIKDNSDYGAIQFAYNASDNLSLGAGYYMVKSKNFTNIYAADEDTNGIWSLGFDYKFTPDVKFGAVYAGSDAEAGSLQNSDEENAYSVQLTYKGAQSAVPQSYGLWLAYRQIGAYASVHPTYDGVMYSAKGVELGVDYMIDQNILAKLVYFDGEYITSGVDVNKIFGRVEFQF